MKAFSIQVLLSHGVEWFFWALFQRRITAVLVPCLFKVPCKMNILSFFLAAMQNLFCLFFHFFLLFSLSHGARQIIGFNKIWIVLSLCQKLLMVPEALVQHKISHQCQLFSIYSQRLCTGSPIYICGTEMLFKNMGKFLVCLVPNIYKTLERKIWQFLIIPACVLFSKHTNCHFHRKSSVLTLMPLYEFSLWSLQC